MNNQGIIIQWNLPFLAPAMVEIQTFKKVLIPFSILNIQITTIINMYEYKFIRIRTSIWSGLPKQDYRKVIQAETKEGWRLIQILTPTGISMLPSFYELIFERLKAEFV